MWCFSGAIAPDVKDDILKSITHSAELLSKLGENAPFGVGALCVTVGVFLKLAKDAGENSGEVLNLCMDIEAILEAFEGKTFDDGLMKAVENMRVALEKANRVVFDFKSSGAMTRFFMAGAFKEDLADVGRRLLQVKATLTLGVTMGLMAGGRHVIPGTRDVFASVGVLKSLHDLTSYQCMIEKRGKRCENTMAKYGLVCKSNKNVNYVVCGHCAADRQNAWWKGLYQRVKLADLN